MTDSDKAGAVGIAAQLHDLGFAIVATRGTAAAIARMGIPVERLNKIAEGSPHVVDWIERGDVDLVINTPTGTAARSDGYEIRARGDRPRDPLHHDAVRRGWRRRARSRPARHGERRRSSRCRSCTRDGSDDQRRDRARSRRSAGGCARSCRTSRSAPTTSSPSLDPEGRRREPGQFYMLAASERWGGGADERPFLPRAFSVLRRHEDGRLDFLLEDVGPGTRGCASCAPATGCGCSGRSGSASARRATGGARCWSAAGSAIAPLRDLAGRARPDDRAVLLGFRDAAHAEGADAARAAPRVATDDGSVGHHGLVTELLARGARRRLDATVYACGPPPMLEAVRALCAEREVPAQLALESGMACGFGACFGCVVPTRERLRPPVRRRPGARRRRRWSVVRMTELLRHRARAPDHQRLGHVRRDRRAARLRRRAARALPVRRVRLQDGHRRAAPGQPAAAAVGDCPAG